MFLCSRSQTKLGVGMRKIIYLLFAFMPICVYASSCPSGFIAITEEYLTLEDYVCEVPLREISICGDNVLSSVCYMLTCAKNQYLEDEECKDCPDGGTAPEGNVGGITSCYIPAQQVITDEYGNTFYYSSDCSWTDA